METFATTPGRSNGPENLRHEVVELGSPQYKAWLNYLLGRLEQQRGVDVIENVELKAACFKLKTLIEVVGKQNNLWFKKISHRLTGKEETLVEVGWSLCETVALPALLLAVERETARFYAESAERYGLELREFFAFPKAQQLFRLVQNGSFLLDTSVDRSAFVTCWERDVPELPLPCVPELNDFWFLQNLQQQKLIQRSGKVDSLLVYDFSAQMVYVEKSDKEAAIFRERLGLPTDFSRQQLENALWQKNHQSLVPTAIHQGILQNIFKDKWPLYEIGCMAYDEALRYFSGGRNTDFQTPLHVDGFLQRKRGASFSHGLVTNPDLNFPVEWGEMSSVRALENDNEIQPNTQFVLVIRKRRSFLK